MNQVARQGLQRLLRMAENAVGKGSDKAVTLRFSEKSFPDYHSLPTHAEKQACNADLLLANRQGAIDIEWDRRAGERTHVTRILLKEQNALAEFLGVTPRWNVVAQAKKILLDLVDAYPFLNKVIEQWEKGLKPRGTLPDQTQDWIDSIKVVEYCRNRPSDDIPVRRLSAFMFQDSKRIESLSSIIDAISQNDLAAPSRPQEEVFSEVGLVKFPPTFLIAGDIEVLYDGVTASVLAPYLGFAPSSIDGFHIAPEIIGILSVENLTTFHELANRRTECPDLIILYTGGMPSRGWVIAYRKLLLSLPEHANVWHWGDIDGGGFRIADRIAGICHEQGHSMELHMMGKGMAINPSVIRHKMSANEVGQIVRICTRHEWTEESDWVVQSKLALEQESLPIIWPHGEIK